MGKECVVHGMLLFPIDPRLEKWNPREIRFFLFVD